MRTIEGSYCATPRIVSVVLDGRTKVALITVRCDSVAAEILVLVSVVFSRLKMRVRNLCSLLCQ